MMRRDGGTGCIARAPPGDQYEPPAKSVADEWLGFSQWTGRGPALERKRRDGAPRGAPWFRNGSWA
jgi:hypothetical protein